MRTRIRTRTACTWRRCAGPGQAGSSADRTHPLPLTQTKRWASGGRHAYLTRRNAEQGLVAWRWAGSEPDKQSSRQGIGAKTPGQRCVHVEVSATSRSPSSPSGLKMTGWGKNKRDGEVHSLVSADGQTGFVSACLAPDDGDRTGGGGGRGGCCGLLLQRDAMMRCEQWAMRTAESERAHPPPSERENQTGHFHPPGERGVSVPASEQTSRKPRLPEASAAAAAAAAAEAASKRRRQRRSQQK